MEWSSVSVGCQPLTCGLTGSLLQDRLVAVRYARRRVPRCYQRGDEGCTIPIPRRCAQAPTSVKEKLAVLLRGEGRAMAVARVGAHPGPPARQWRPSSFRRCVEAIAAGVLITRANAGDKEVHFQNWFGRPGSRPPATWPGLKRPTARSSALPDLLFDWVKTTIAVALGWRTRSRPPSSSASSASRPTPRLSDYQRSMRARTERSSNDGGTFSFMAQRSSVGLLTRAAR